MALSDFPKYIIHVVKNRRQAGSKLIVEATPSPIIAGITKIASLIVGNIWSGASATL